ncbi:MAG: AAA family ATPase, partial [Candidatus Sericytochromatia bacterium]
MRLKYKIPLIKNKFLIKEGLINNINIKIKSHKILFVSSPSGYGKTSIISQWAKQQKDSIIWLSLDKFSNNLNYFVCALINSFKYLDNSLFENDLIGNIDDLNLITMRIIDTIEDAKKKLILIIDDLHYIESKKVYNTLEFFLNNLPENLKVIIMSRNKVEDIPFSLLRNKDEVFEINSDNLRFSFEDLKKVFSNKLVSEEQLIKIYEKTEGWIFAIQVFSILIDDSNDIDDLINSFSGNNLLISDFLINRVLYNLDEEVQKFLFITSILNKFNHELAYHITGLNKTEKIILLIEKKNLFLVSLDSNREWFRYHSLFSETLNSCFHKKYYGHTNLYYKKAYNWLKDNNFFDESVYYAEIIKDYDFIIEIISEQYKKLIDEINYFKLYEWLKKVPIDYLIKCPFTFLIYIECLNEFRKINETKKYISLFDNKYDINNLSKEILAFYYKQKLNLSKLILDIENIKVNCDNFLKYTDDNSPYIYSFLGVYYFYKNNDINAFIKYLNLYNFYLRKNTYRYIVGLINKATLLLECGLYNDSYIDFLEILQIIDKEKKQSFNRLLTLIYSNLSLISYYKNNIKNCYDYMQKSINYINQMQSYRLLRASYNSLLTTNLMLGNLNNFKKLLLEIKIINNESIYNKDELFISLGIRREIRENILDNCNLFIQERMQLKDLDSLKYIYFNSAFAFIESLIFMNKFEDAEVIINKLNNDISNFNKNTNKLVYSSKLIELFLLKSLLNYKKGNIKVTKEFIKKSLLLAENQNIIRIHIDFFKELHPIILNILNIDKDLSSGFVNDLKNEMSLLDNTFLTNREIE